MTDRRATPGGRRRTRALGRVAALALLVAVPAGAVSACGGSDDAGPDPLQVGVINPFSGDFALYGEEVTRGYEIAVDEVNRAGGVRGRPVEILRGDAQTPDQAITQAERLTAREEVDLLAGTYISAVAGPASDVSARTETFYWETNATADALTEFDLPTYMRFGPRASDFADVSARAMPAIARAAGKDLRDARIYVEHEDSSYGTSVGTRQAALLREAGAQVVGVGAHASDATDVSDSVLRAARTRPDVWLITGYVPDTNLLLRTATGQGFAPTTVLTGTGDTAETLQSVGAEGLAGKYVVAYPGADVTERYAPGADAFLRAYRARYRGEPRAPQSLTAYAGMKLLLRVVQQTGTTRPAELRRAIEALDLPESSQPSGYGVRFDASGQNQRAKPVVVQWQRDGGKDTVFPQSAAGSAAIEDESR